MSKETGGAAFPCEQSETQDGRWNHTFEPGMTLRDYFAAKAMQALIPEAINQCDGISIRHDENNLGIAKAAYSVADAMLYARDQ